MDLDTAGAHPARRHRLEHRHFDALAAGGGGAGTISRLRAVERSWRLVQLRAVLDAAREQPAATGPLPPMAQAWELLVAAERQDPAEVDELLLHPQAGTWAGYLLRRMRGSTSGPVPLWVDLGYLHALAAAAALRVGLDFRIAVPVRDGFAVLPTLGAAQAPQAPRWDQAEVRRSGGAGFVDVPGGVVAVGGEGWVPLPSVRVQAAGQALVVSLDSIDPYRNLRTPTPPQPFPAAELARWRDLLSRAWHLLVEAFPHLAPALARGLSSIVPQPPAQRFRTMSASAGDAFGSMLVSELCDATELAVTMVHEFQHIKLGALLHLTPMHQSEPPQRLYAPWRDDPRPLGGLLQGVYAFTGITGFWAVVRQRLGGGDAQLAQFEFARWRQQVSAALAMLADLPQLSGAGRRLLAGLSSTAERWRAAQVPAEPLAAAAAAAADHRVRWRLHHLRPDPPLVAAFARAWLAGAPRPQLPYPAPVVVADPAARGLDARAVLAMWRMTDPAGYARLRDDPDTVGERVTGATAADLALLAGEHDRARADYQAELAADPDRPSSWGGLRLALAAQGAGPAADALRERPELVRQVHRAVRESRGAQADPVALATWLGAG
jgi:HEXXH motif-containing protein